MQQINNTTYQSTDLGDVKPIVTMGGFSADKFYPNVNNSFHDDEFYFNLNAVDDSVSDELASETDGVISQTINNEKHEYYIDDSGRLKWDKLFYSYPDSMRARFKVRKSAGVKFYYQGELTPEEIADGCERPDDIIGSYAVYCDKANNNYKTGKLCHIPRPFVIDAHGNREWCVMTYEEISDTEGMLYIDLPESFMQSAAYPVRLDPTLGYTSAGASGYNWDSSVGLSMMDMVGYSAASSGTTDNIYIHASKQISSNMTVELGYYQSTARQAYTTKTGGWATGWNTLSFSGNTITSGNTYRCALSVYGDWGGSEAFGVSYDSVSNADQYWWDKISDTATYSSGGNDNIKFSVYLAYTESGSTGNSYYYQQQQM